MTTRLMISIVVLFFAVEAYGAPKKESSDGIRRWTKAHSIPVTTKRNPAFRVPEKLKPRVKFWIDIFAKYSKYNVVIHHRMHPHIIFDVLHFESLAEKLSPGKYERERKRLGNVRVGEIKSALKKLSKGQAPSSTLEQHIAKQMSSLGPGRKKYSDVLKHGWVRSQRGIRERYREAIERSGRYMHILERVFVLEYGLPIELTRLPFVESSFDYKAYSSVGAAGIWQFMPATGRLYDLKVTRVLDERRDVTAASKAAARYLLDAHGRLGTWPLALTSYNHGIYGVLKKVRKLKTKNIADIVEIVHGQPFGFASQNFYPEFLAALEIYENPQKYFPGVRVEQPREISRRKLSRTVSVSELVKKLGVPKAELQSVNYALHDRVWQGRYSIPAGYTLNVGSNHHDKLANLKLGPPVKTVSASSVYGGSVYTVRRGDTLGKIAKRYGTRVSTIKQLNGLRSDIVRVGQKLRIEEKSYISTVRKTPVTSSGRTHTVRRGDTLFDIARSHRTTVSALKSVNNLKSSRIRVGQKLKLPSGAPSSHRESDVNYRVKSGDSLWKISTRYGVPISKIKSRNNLRSNSLRPGQTLVIPR